MFTPSMTTIGGVVYSSREELIVSHPTVNVKFTHPKASMPKYQTDGASGMDLCCVEQFTLHPHETKIIDTGLVVEIPEGYEGQVRSRSGLAAKHSVAVLNAPGTIDRDYRGAVGVILHNHSEEDFMVDAGTRIAQLVICPVVQADMVESTALSLTTRGSGGFGSTGVSKNPPKNTIGNPQDPWTTESEYFEALIESDAAKVFTLFHDWGHRDASYREDLIVQLVQEICSGLPDEEPICNRIAETNACSFGFDEASVGTTMTTPDAQMIRTEVNVVMAGDQMEDHGWFGDKISFKLYIEIDFKSRSVRYLVADSVIVHDD